MYSTPEPIPIAASFLFVGVVGCGVGILGDELKKFDLL